MDNNQKEKILNKVLSDTVFQKSPSNTALLKYLVKKNIEGTYLKEGIIEIEFYGGNHKYDKANSRVRVNMYNLRKKLKTYYENNGQKDNNKLTIEKGQYNVSFTQKNKPKKTNKTRNLILLGISIPIILGIIYLIFTKQNNSPWHRFFNNKKENIVYIDDYFGLLGKTPIGNIGWTRDIKTHNINDYYKSIKQNQNISKLLKPAHYYYTNRSSVLATHKLSNFFNNNKNNFRINFANDVNYANTKNHNLIYVGSTTKEQFLNLFNSSNPYCKIKKSRIIIKGHSIEKDTSLYFHTQSSSNWDYAVISKQKGPNNTEQFYFFSKHEIGILSGIDYFTNKDSLKTFYEKKLKGKNNFTAVYKVYGDKRVNLETEEITFISF